MRAAAFQGRITKTVSDYSMYIYAKKIESHVVSLSD